MKHSRKDRHVRTYVSPSGGAVPIDFTPTEPIEKHFVNIDDLIIRVVRLEQKVSGLKKKMKKSASEARPVTASREQAITVTHRGSPSNNANGNLDQGAQGKTVVATVAAVGLEETGVGSDDGVNGASGEEPDGGRVTTERALEEK